MHTFLIYFIYAAGWLIYLYGQMEGSLRSKSNGLAVSWAGRWQWITVQSDQLLKRGFFSVIGAPVIIQLVIKKIAGPLESAGLQVAVWSAAGIAGYCANNIVYQGLGFFTDKIPLFGNVRAEIPELAPTEDLKAKLAQGQLPDAAKP